MPLKSMKKALRTEHGLLFIETLLQDVRYALRTLRKSPGFTVVAVLTLALGIGANTAIFSVVDAILLKPLPYPDANRLAIIWSTLGNERRAPSSGYAFEQIRGRSHIFDDIGGIWVTNGTIISTSDPHPEAIKLADVTPDFLSLLCSHPFLGRLFTAQDVPPNVSTVAVISYGLWQRRFGGDPRIVGQTVHIGDAALVILGVLPKEFQLIFPDDASVPASPDVYVLLKGKQFGDPGGPEFLRLVGRVRVAATFSQAQSEANEIAARLKAAIPGYSSQNYHLRIIPLQRDDVRNVSAVLRILFGGVGFVLLIACANVDNLLLARAGKREQEAIVRVALGATRSRIIRQLLTESIVLGVLGGIAALGIGWGALQALLALRPESLLRLGAIRLSPLAFAFTFALAIITGALFGLAPALSSVRVNLTDGLKEGARNLASRRQTSKAALVITEVTLSFALLTGTGLLSRTFVNVLHADPGFQPKNVLSFTPLGGDYSFLHQLQENLYAIPGVESVSVVSHLPLDDSYPNWYDHYWPEGTPASQQNTVMADDRSVLPGYFKTIGARLIEGRDFTDSDDAARQHVVIVDDALAQRAWSGQDPIGRKLHVSDSPTGPYQFQDDWVVVVGVVRHIQYHSLTVMVRPQIYFPYQLAPRPVSFVVRASTRLPSLIAPIRQEVSKLGKNVAIARFISLPDLVTQARSQTQFVTFLAAALAILALFLTCVGIYGINSYLVMSRTRELGIRMALGATPANVLRLVFVRGMAAALLGCVFGIVLSFPLTPLLSSLLFGVHPFDISTLVAAALFLSAVCFVACFVPARRATRVDPMTALRHE